MKYAFLLFLIGALVQEVPYKPKDEFDLKLDYTFKQRPPDEITTIKFDETQEEKEKRTSAAMLPYLIIRVSILKPVVEETKVKIINNLDRSPIVKKLKEGTVINLQLGFTDDIKDRVTPHEYTLTFVSNEKKELSRILIFIDSDGTFSVNGEKRGKF